MTTDFHHGDIVWGKVSGLPHWPGQILDASFASKNVLATYKPGRSLVCFFGDDQYNWLDPSALRAFHSSKDPVVENSRQYRVKPSWRRALEQAQELLDRRASRTPATLHFPRDFLLDPPTSDKPPTVLALPAPPAPAQMQAATVALSPDAFRKHSSALPPSSALLPTPRCTTALVEAAPQAVWVPAEPSWDRSVHSPASKWAFNGNETCRMALSWLKDAARMPLKQIEASTPSSDPCLEQRQLYRLLLMRSHTVIQEGAKGAVCIADYVNKQTPFGLQLTSLDRVEVPRKLMKKYLTDLKAAPKFPIHFNLLLYINGQCQPALHSLEVWGSYEPDTQAIRYDCYGLDYALQAYADRSVYLASWKILDHDRLQLDMMVHRTALNWNEVEQKMDAEEEEHSGKRVKVRKFKPRAVAVLGFPTQVYVDKQQPAHTHSRLAKAPSDVCSDPAAASTGTKQAMSEVSELPLSSFNPSDTGAGNDSESMDLYTEGTSPAKKKRGRPPRSGKDGPSKAQKSVPNSGKNGPNKAQKSVPNSGKDGPNKAQKSVPNSGNVLARPASSTQAPSSTPSANGRPSNGEHLDTEVAQNKGSRTIWPFASKRVPMNGISRSGSESALQIGVSTPNCYPANNKSTEAPANSNGTAVPANSKGTAGPANSKGTAGPAKEVAQKKPRAPSKKKQKTGAEVLELHAAVVCEESGAKGMTDKQVSSDGPSAPALSAGGVLDADGQLVQNLAGQAFGCLFDNVFDEDLGTIPPAVCDSAPVAPEQQDQLKMMQQRMEVAEKLAQLRFETLQQQEQLIQMKASLAQHLQTRLQAAESHIQQLQHHLPALSTLPGAQPSSLRIAAIAHRLSHTALQSTLPETIKIQLTALAGKLMCLPPAGSTPTVLTQPSRAPTVLTQPNCSPAMLTQPGRAPTVLTQPNCSPAVLTQPGRPPTVLTRPPALTGPSSPSNSHHLPYNSSTIPTHHGSANAPPGTFHGHTPLSQPTNSSSLQRQNSCLLERQTGSSFQSQNGTVHTPQAAPHQQTGPQGSCQPNRPDPSTTPYRTLFSPEQSHVPLSSAPQDMHLASPSSCPSSCPGTTHHVHLSCPAVSFNRYNATACAMNGVHTVNGVRSAAPHLSPANEAPFRTPYSPASADARLPAPYASPSTTTLYSDMRFQPSNTSVSKEVSQDMGARAPYTSGSAGMQLTAAHTSSLPGPTPFMNTWQALACDLPKDPRTRAPSLQPGVQHPAAQQCGNTQMERATSKSKEARETPTSTESLHTSIIQQNARQQDSNHHAFDTTTAQQYIPDAAAPNHSLRHCVSDVNVQPPSTEASKSQPHASPVALKATKPQTQTDTQTCPPPMQPRNPQSQSHPINPQLHTPSLHPEADHSQPLIPPLHPEPKHPQSLIQPLQSEPKHPQSLIQPLHSEPKHPQSHSRPLHPEAMNPRSHPQPVHPQALRPQSNRHPPSIGLMHSKGGGVPRPNGLFPHSRPPLRSEPPEEPTTLGVVPSTPDTLSERRNSGGHTCGSDATDTNTATATHHAQGKSTVSEGILGRDPDTKTGHTVVCGTQHVPAVEQPNAGSMATHPGSTHAMQDMGTVLHVCSGPCNAAHVIAQAGAKEGHDGMVRVSCCGDSGTICHSGSPCQNGPLAGYSGSPYHSGSPRHIGPTLDGNKIPTTDELQELHRVKPAINQRPGSACDISAASKTSGSNNKHSLYSSILLCTLACESHCPPSGTKNAGNGVHHHHQGENSNGDAEMHMKHADTKHVDTSHDMKSHHPQGHSFGLRAQHLLFCWIYLQTHHLSTSRTTSLHPAPNTQHLTIQASVKHMGSLTMVNDCMGAHPAEVQKVLGRGEPVASVVDPADDLPEGSKKGTGGGTTVGVSQGEATATGDEVVGVGVMDPHARMTSKDASMPSGTDTGRPATEPLPHPTQQVDTARAGTVHSSSGTGAHARAPAPPLEDTVMQDITSIVSGQQTGAQQASDKQAVDVDGTGKSVGIAVQKGWEPEVPNSTNPPAECTGIDHENGQDEGQARNSSKQQQHELIGGARECVEGEVGKSSDCTPRNGTKEPVNSAGKCIEGRVEKASECTPRNGTKEAANGAGKCVDNEVGKCVEGRVEKVSECPTQNGKKVPAQVHAANSAGQGTENGTNKTQEGVVEDRSGRLVVTSMEGDKVQQGAGQNSDEQLARTADKSAGCGGGGGERAQKAGEEAVVNQRANTAGKSAESGGEGGERVQKAGEEVVMKQHANTVGKSAESGGEGGERVQNTGQEAVVKADADEDEDEQMGYSPELAMTEEEVLYHHIPEAAEALLDEHSMLVAHTESIKDSRTGAPLQALPASQCQKRTRGLGSPDHLIGSRFKRCNTGGTAHGSIQTVQHMLHVSNTIKGPQLSSYESTFPTSQQEGTGIDHSKLPVLQVLPVPPVLQGLKHSVAVSNVETDVSDTRMISDMTTGDGVMGQGLMPHAPMQGQMQGSPPTTVQGKLQSSLPTTVQGKLQGSLLATVQGEMPGSLPMSGQVMEAGMQGGGLSEMAAGSGRPQVGSMHPAAAAPVDTHGGQSVGLRNGGSGQEDVLQRAFMIGGGQQDSLQRASMIGGGQQDSLQQASMIGGGQQDSLQRASMIGGGQRDPLQRASMIGGGAGGGVTHAVRERELGEQWRSGTCDVAAVEGGSRWQDAAGQDGTGAQATLSTGRQDPVPPANPAPAGTGIPPNISAAGLTIMDAAGRVLLVASDQQLQYDMMTRMQLFSISKELMECVA